jgi:hypothetical protein
MVEIVPGRELAGVGGEPTLDIGTHVAGGSREGRNEVGVAGGERAVSGKRGLGGRRSRGGESQLVEAFTQSVLEGHGGACARAATGLLAALNHWPRQNKASHGSPSSAGCSKGRWC